MSTTKQMYEYLTKVHGINDELCRHCLCRNIEVYQDNWESCYYCWCTECTPKISPPPED